MDAAIFSLSFAVAAFVVFALCKPFDRRLTLAAGALFALYLGLDDLVTGLASSVPALAVVGGAWNWSGKLYSLALAALVALALGIKPAALGLTLRQRHLGTSLAVLGLFVVWGLGLGLWFKPGVADAETLAFQVSMPGLAEELAYRGIAPALLLGWIGGREPRREERMPWAAIVATAVVFGLWHGLGYARGAYSFDPMSALFPFIGSLAGGWLRFRSGSLLFPLLIHSVANLAFHLSAYLDAYLGGG
ncbi:CPBP family intramembrane glutamic endopeptidase [Lysobacter yananisis]|uniref:CPBP family intramembrane glutamic endopeptidase n=1 Tax=Lysobacter yananisis TaxID=1003114 RepID=A0ABY9P785_9GAMM|nr:CPBP family intramembrane glutamic endopeptidase [Lysobacter yananisis]WMT01885.1 CPBP family intramembrane glutamic endopeptidase [Lysobacter yananisis]